MDLNVVIVVVVCFVVFVVVAGLLVSRYFRRRVRKLQLTADLQGVATDDDDLDEVRPPAAYSAFCDGGRAPKRGASVALDGGV